MRCARRLIARRDHRRDGNRPDGGALGFGATLPHRIAQRHDGVRRLRQHRRSGAQGSPWMPCSGRQGSQRFRRR
jgi:hypothetical protein